MKKHAIPSLERRFIILFFILILSLSIIGAYFSWYFSNQFREDIAGRNMSLAHSIRDQVHEFLLMQASELKGLRNVLGFPEISGGKEQHELVHTLAAHPFIESIEILDDEGRITHAAPFKDDRIDLDLSKQDYFREARGLSPEDIFFSDVTMPIHGDNPFVTISISMEKGVLAAHLNLQKMSDIIHVSFPGSNSFIAVTDRWGIPIAHTDWTVVSRIESLKNLAGVVRGLQGEEGSFQDKWRDRKGLSSVSIVEDAGWLIVIFQSDDEAFGVVDRMEIVTQFSLLSILLIVFGFLFVMLKRFLRPIKELRGQMRSVAEGRYEMEISPQYQEFSGFVESFREMAKAVQTREEDLKQAYSTMEALVSSSPLAIITVDRESRVKMWNSAAESMFGWKKEEVHGKISPEIPKEICKKSSELIERISKGETIYGMETVRQTKKGSLVEVRLYATALDNGEVMAVMADMEELKFAEEQVRESEKRYRLLADNSTDVIWTMDLDLNFIYISPSVEKMMGLTSEEAIRQSVADVLTPDSLVLTKKGLADFLKGDGPGQIETGCPLILELEMYREDGSKIWGEVSVNSIRDADGKIIGIQGVTRDITERRGAEAALRRSEEKYRRVVEDQTELIVRWLPDGTRTFVNGNYCEYFGQKFEDVIETGFFHYLSEEEKEKVLKRVEALTKNNPVQSAEQFVKNLDGKRTWVQWTDRGMFNDSGDLVEIQSIGRDVTELKKYQLELAISQESVRESEERLRQLFMQYQDAFIIMDAETLDIVDVNTSAVELYGYSRDELINQPSTIFMSEEAGKQFAGKVEKKMTDRLLTIDEMVHRKRDGTEIIVSFRGQLVQLVDREVLYCSFRDITERIRLEQETKLVQSRLIQANRMTALGRMVSSVAHEINNPNNTIMFNARLMEGAWSTASPILQSWFEEHGDFDLGGLPYSEMRDVVPRLIQGTHYSSNLIKGIVDDLKNFYREQDATKVSDVDLNDVVRNAISLLGSQATQYIGRVEVDLAEGLPSVPGNHQKLIQVVVNLLTNSFESLERKQARVYVKTIIDDDGKATLLVRDQGKGMTEEELADALEPFFTTKLESGGTGLGLSITDSLLQEHGADLRIESKIGKGTVVTVTFPHAEESSEGEEADTSTLRLSD